MFSCHILFIFFYFNDLTACICHAVILLLPCSHTPAIQYHFRYPSVRFSSKPQNIEIEFLCKVVKLANAILSPKIFMGNSLGNPPKMGPQKSLF